MEELKLPPELQPIEGLIRVMRALRRSRTNKAIKSGSRGADSEQDLPAHYPRTTRAPRTIEMWVREGVWEKNT